MRRSRLGLALLVTSSTLVCAAGVHAQAAPPPAPVLLAPGEVPPSGGGGTPTGFPGPSDTGVPAGVTLTSCSGNLSTNGATYDRCLFSGGVFLSATNVTITRSRIVGGLESSSYSNRVVLVDVEIDGQNNSNDAFHNLGFYTCTRCKVHDVAKCFSGQGITVEDSYCYDIYGSGDSHNEPVLAYGTSPIILRRNNLVANWNSARSGGGMSSVVSLYSHGQNFGAVDNVTIEGNRFESTGGAVFCVYAGYSGDYSPTNMKFRDNVFAGGTMGGCSAPITGWRSGSNNVWSNNRYDSGQVIPEPASVPYQ